MRLSRAIAWGIVVTTLAGGCGSSDTPPAPTGPSTPQTPTPPTIPSGLTPTLHPGKAPARWVDQTYEAARTRECLDYRPRPLLTGLLEEAAWIRDGADPRSMLDYDQRGLAAIPEGLG